MRRAAVVALAVALGWVGGVAAQQQDVQTASVTGFQFVLDDSRIIEAGERATGVLAVGARVEVDGQVAGDVAMVGGTLSVRGTVSDDIFVIGTHVRLLSGARIVGDVWTLGGSVTVSAGATVLGTLRDASYWEKEFNRQWDGGEGFVRFAAGYGWVAFLVNALALIVLGYLLLHFLRRPMQGIARGMARRFFASLGIGVAAAVVLLPLAVLLLVIGFGVPLVYPLVALYALAAYLGLVGAAVWLEGAFATTLRRPRRVGGVLFLLAAIIVSGARAIPWAGQFLTLVLGLVGLGSCIITRFGCVARGTEPSASDV